MERLDKNSGPEAETAITKLPVNEQDYRRFQVAHNIKLLYKQCKGNKDHNNKTCKKRTSHPQQYQGKIINQQCHSLKS